MYRVVIPARYASTRLPGKPLVKLKGRPLIQWVYERARRSRAAEVLVATDDERIAEAATAFGAPVVLTSIVHASGTDRIAEVAAQRGWEDAEVVVNLQGDEPLMPEALIDQDPPDRGCGAGAVAIAEVVGHGVTLRRKGLEPHGGSPVVVGQRDGGGFRTPRTSTATTHGRKATGGSCLRRGWWSDGAGCRRGRVAP